MSKRGIIGAGNWIVDRLNTIDRWPNVGELCLIRATERAGGGGPCNVLFDLAALAAPDLPLYAAGVVGDDADGRFLRAEIERRGIDGRFLRTSAATPTSYTDVMSGDGKRTFFHFAGANAELDRNELEAIDVPAKFFYLGYLLLLDRLDRTDPAGGTVAARLLNRMRQRGYRTAVDLVSAAPERFGAVVPPALPQVDVLIVNEIEAGNLCGRPLRRPDGTLAAERLPETAAKLLEHGVRELAVIHFPEGAYAARPDGVRLYRPACRIAPESIAGTTGAGDAFFAGLLYALHEDFELDRALDLAAASAAFNLASVSASGGAPRLPELLHFAEHAEYAPVPDPFRH